MKAKITPETVRDAVLSLYLQHKSASAEDIAKHLNCSTSSVHKVMRNALGNVPGTAQAQSCGRTRTYWVPERSYLAQIVKDQRKTLETVKRALEHIQSQSFSDVVAVACVTALQEVERSLGS